ncbi:MAG: Gfo/Idh/MocA family oxidoreductase [Candidatus Lokiarchaeota archaeon]|nr:Gfo/Idh/MocA family oxidoreductase [Candidatus Lokiarchaeota archaeon]
MSQKKVEESHESHSRILSRDMRWKYLDDKDRYLFATPTPRYKFNVIGAGMMGIEHMKITHLEGRGEIHGFFDPNERIKKVNKLLAAKDLGVKLKVYDTLEECCSDPDVDGLIVSSPNYTHISIARVIAEKAPKKHILMEKPMCTKVEDAYEMMQIAKKHQAVFQIGLQYRYKAMYTEAIHEAFERKSLGNLKLISIVEHRIPFLDKVDQWNKFAKYSGDTIVEKCCHYMDLLNLFAQSKPQKVYASGSQAVNFKKFKYENQTSDILDNALIIVDYENSLRAGFNLCMFAPQTYEEVTLCGDQGRLRAFENEDFLDNSIPKTLLEIYRGENHPSRVMYPTYPDFVAKTGHNGASFYNHIKFMDKIDGKDTLTGVPNIATVEEGFWSIVLGAAAQESIESGQAVIIKDFLDEKGIRE